MSHLSAEQVAQFEEQGYLVVEQLLDPVTDLDPIIEEYKGVLNRLAEDLVEKGEIRSLYEELPFGERLIKIYQESGKVHAQYFDFSLPQGGVKHDTPMWVGKAVFNALTSPRLLDAVESIIGPEIYSNPVQHVRIKPPEHLTPKNENGVVQLGATPWHQDNGVVLPEADETDMLTVWFPLLDAPIEAGPLRVVPYSHREGLLTHCPGGVGGLAIPEQLFAVQEGVAVPLKRGDALFLTKRTVHSSLSNISENIRWSFDLRYNPIGQATGRGAFPGFVARSRQNPQSELHDAAEWANLWRATRQRMADENANSPFNRWDSRAMVCA
jgi:ectoine hydroxylase-related dioxygenase (phytanoyl-CoA dioxygenase family)